MKTTLTKWVFMAAAVLGLSLSVTACKDDDNSDGGNNAGGESSVEMPLSDDEAVLAQLLPSFCDFDAQDAAGGLLSQTFEPTVGDVADASQPLVRTIVIGTQEAADAYASRVLGVVGAGDSPVGFCWQNSAIGSLSYAHGTGNELGVLTVGIRQIPGLTKLRLVRDPEGNAPGDPYYHRGDIVRHQGRLYLCVSNHRHGEKSRWISFDATREEAALQAKGTCSWSGVGKDSVYSKTQASSATLAEWIEYFLLNDQNYNTLLTHLQSAGITADEQRAQLVPPTTRRSAFIANIRSTEPKTDFILEPWKIMEGEQRLRIKDSTWPTTNPLPNTTLYYPINLLLANTQRWSMGFTYDYWVPYMVIVPTPNALIDQTAQQFEALLNSLPSQNNTGIKGHFKWKRERAVTILEGTYTGFYNIYTVAVHWTHTAMDKANQDDPNEYGLLNFTHNYGNTRWASNCVTSHEMTFTDKGRAYSKFTEVYHGNGGEDNNGEDNNGEEPQAPDPFAGAKVGDWIDSSGNLQRNSSGNVVARVVYVGARGSVEKGTDYRGLAIALGTPSYRSYTHRRPWYEANSSHAGTCAITREDNLNNLATVLDGIACTESLIDGCGQGHEHPAALSMNQVRFNFQSKGMSRWFLPSAGQWLLALESGGWSVVNGRLQRNQNTDLFSSVMVGLSVQSFFYINENN